MANPVARRAVRRAKKRGASPRVIKALVEAGLVESNLQHERYSKPGSGDRDSVGFLQQRPSQGWGPPGESVERDTDQFLEKAMRLNRGFRGSAGQLAQAVQRSAFPGRYDERSGEAEQILRRLNGGGGSQPGSRSSSSTESRTTPGVDNSDVRRQILAAYVQSERGKPGALLNLKAQLDGAQDVPGETIKHTTTKTERTKRSSGKPRKSGKNSTDIEQLLRVAQRDFGLTVREHPAFDKVDPVHTDGSFHYRKARKSKGAAGDVSGAPERMAAFAAYVRRRHGRDVEELIFNGPGGGKNIKNGRRVPRGFYRDHETHAHVADDD